MYLRPIHLIDLLVEGEEVVEQPDAEQTAGQQIEHASADFAHVEPVNAE